ncbi:MAG: hypothetical protein Q9217_002346 [Psora testacea]
MAPDINSLPPSPYRSQAASITRRPSEARRLAERVTSPPTNLISSTPPRSPILHSISSSQVMPREDNTGVDPGPGPLRHPRPLTAADLHMQLEKEQEAVVNRLTRELTLLRQQTASAASTASSTSAGLADAADSNAHSTLLGASHPTSSRRHRSSSNLSARSVNTAAPTATAGTGVSGSTTGGIAGSTTSGIAPPRESTVPYSYTRDPLSRQSSVASRRSEASSPSLSSSLYQGDHFPNYTHRHTSSVTQATNASVPLAPTGGSTRSSYIPSTARYDEAVHARAELEMVKQENEALKQRIRELERNIRTRRQSETGQRRRESLGMDTGAASRGRRPAHEEEDAVNVEESAASVGHGEVFLFKEFIKYCDAKKLQYAVGIMNDNLVIMESTPPWDDLDWNLGQLFMMGFDGTEVTPQIKKLIETHHLGTVLLTAKNLKSAEQTAKLVLDLQTIAHNANHPVPLAIALDQENGGVNSLFDAEYIQQFPSAMGVAATGSTDMAFEIAKATAEELDAVGINWIMGPCLDVLANIKNQSLGVRSSGDDPEEVSRYGIAAMNGYKEAGLATCGKHFPSYGNLEFLGSALDVPVITDSLEQLSANALGPFRDAIHQDIDAMMVGGCAMSSAGVEAMHACLSDRVVDGLLRKEMGFKGVVISECLEMEALSQNIGVGGGTVMAVKAGCDLLLVCRSIAGQLEAFNGLKAGLDNDLITKERVQQSLSRILHMKAKSMSWEKALAPGGVVSLSPLQPLHAELSEKAYNSSITVVRDKERLLPLSNLLDPDDELLLLTPLVKPLPASAASALHSNSSSPEPPASTWQKSVSGMSGENVFQEFGRSLARQRGGRVLHTSYTANGMRPVHENLIHRASAVIVVTADANRNLYQHGFTKHVSMSCKLSQRGEKRGKPFVVVSVSSPYDFAMESSLGTYICTFDFTETALQALVHVLYGEFIPSGSLPGSLRKNQKVHQSKQHWLVEQWDQERDAHGLDALLMNIHEENSSEQPSVLANCTYKTFHLHMIHEQHFVVRNTSTQALYGFCPTYFFESTCTGVVGPILVDPERRNLSIGQSLHKRAVKSLLQRQGIKRLQLGSRLPNVYLGVPSNNSFERKRLRQWFDNLGWADSPSRPVYSMLLPNLPSWTPSERLTTALHNAEVEFDLIQGVEHASQVHDLVRTSSRVGIMEVYGLALADHASCGIIRAKRRRDAILLGAVVLYSASSNWADTVPAIKDSTDVIGGISSPVISPSAGDYSTLLQGLILLGIKQHQKQGAAAVLLDYVDDDGNLDSLSAMGFCVLNNFDEISCDAEIFASLG